MNLKIIYFYEANTSRAPWNNGPKVQTEKGAKKERGGEREGEGVCKKWQLFNTRSTFVGILCVKFFHYVLSAPERGRETEADRGEKSGRCKKKSKPGEKREADWQFEM